VRECLTKVFAQSLAPLDVIVVDASADDATQRLIDSEFPTVRYLRHSHGAGTLATSRNVGLHESKADIIAFVDDDAYPRENWLAELIAQYADPHVGAVGGRVDNGWPGEEIGDETQIGRFHPNGTLTGNFSVDPGRAIAVDHLIGANMSYRRQALLDNGGIHDAYPGTCLREDSDTSSRVRRAGWRIMFVPSAVVDHVSGPYAKGNRFDRRYYFYAARNHVVFLSLVFGQRSRVLRRYFGFAAREAGEYILASLRGLSDARRTGGLRAARTVVGAIVRAFVTAGGLVAGLSAARRYGQTPTS
jgi:GT2 family glycosyltransferase